jgi:myosin heavy subunit
MLPAVAVGCCYVLPQVRLASQAQGERNYHIFYQLLNTVDSELRSR